MFLKIDSLCNRRPVWHYAQARDVPIRGLLLRLNATQVHERMSTICVGKPIRDEDAIWVCRLEEKIDPRTAVDSDVVGNLPLRFTKWSLIDTIHVDETNSWFVWVDCPNPGVIGIEVRWGNKTTVVGKKHMTEEQQARVGYPTQERLEFGKEIVVGNVDDEENSHDYSDTGEMEEGEEDEEGDLMSFLGTTMQHGSGVRTVTVPSKGDAEQEEGDLLEAARMEIGRMTRLDELRPHSKRCVVDAIKWLNVSHWHGFMRVSNDSRDPEIPLMWTPPTSKSLDAHRARREFANIYNRLLIAFLNGSSAYENVEDNPRSNDTFLSLYRREDCEEKEHYTYLGDFCEGLLISLGAVCLMKDEELDSSSADSQGSFICEGDEIWCATFVEKFDVSQGDDDLLSIQELMYTAITYRFPVVAWIARFLGLDDSRIVQKECGRGQGRVSEGEDMLPVEKGRGLIVWNGITATVRIEGNWQHMREEEHVAHVLQTVKKARVTDDNSPSVNQVKKYVVGELNDNAQYAYGIACVQTDGVCTIRVKSPLLPPAGVTMNLGESRTSEEMALGLIHCEQLVHNLANDVFN